MHEKFQPVSNTPPDTFKGFIKFYGRMLFDLQAFTIFHSIKKEINQFRGEVLDIGCGQSAYKFLLDSEVRYTGIDIMEAGKFNYKNPDVILFDGRNIPFENGRFDAFICTEVLEHVSDYQNLVDEMHRVTKDGGRGVITIPWSARNHYIPYDYFRFSQGTLKKIFVKFSKVEIFSRGNDVTAIISKINVLFFRNIFTPVWYKWFLIPLWLIFFPLLLLLIPVAFFSLWLNLGDSNDPLGYTLFVVK